MFNDFRTTTNVFRLHDLRFSLMLLLLFTNICQLCLNTLIAIKVSSIQLILHALVVLCCNLMLTAFIRLIEVKDQYEWLYMVIAIELPQFVISVWKFHHLTHTLIASHLQSIIALFHFICLLLLMVIDGTSRYLEVSLLV